MKLVALILVLSISSICTAMTFEYTVFYPDREKKTYAVAGNKPLEVLLPKVKWRCNVATPPEELDGEKGHKMLLNCNYEDGKNSPFAQTSILCLAGREIGTLNLADGPSDKRLMYQIRIKCEP